MNMTSIDIHVQFDADLSATKHHGVRRVTFVEYVYSCTKVLKVSWGVNLGYTQAPTKNLVLFWPCMGYLCTLINSLLT